VAALHCSAQSTISDPNKFAWSGNTGWMNFRPSAVDGVITGERFLSGYVWAANTGWIRMGSGTPANGYAFANNSATDYGVNHDGAGNLTGLAWSANTGWVNFGWATANDPNRPRFDLVSGNFSGYAWSANTGWVNLGAGFLKTSQILCVDTDGDGMGDAWELQHFGNLTTAGVGTDHDHDGQSDAAEYAADTDPNNSREFLRIVSQTYNAGFTQATLQFTTTQPSRLYRIQRSTTLLATGTGAWADIGSPVLFTPDPGTTTSKTITIPGGLPRQFFRVVAVKPLQP